MNYFEHLMRLLEVELQEEALQFERKVAEKSLHERKKEGFAWYPVQINHIEVGTGEQLHVSLERTAMTGEPHRFQVGDSVAVFHHVPNQKPESTNGVIVALFRDSMRVALPTRETPDWIDEGNIGVDWLFDRASYKEMLDALQTAKKAEKLPLSRLRDVLTGEKQASFKAHPDFFENPRLNDSQNQAVRRVLAAEDVAIIHGPPGTGKTTTLVEAIRVTLQTEKQVLVVAPSNTAVDLLTQKLAAQGIRVLRIGNPARIDEQTQDFSLDAQISHHEEFKLLRKMRRSADDFRKMAHKYKRKFGKDEREQRRLLFAEAHKLLDDAGNIEKYIVESLVNGAQVITATLVGSAHKHLKNKVFSTVFIDEAAQALEPATWIPIARAHRVIFAGDHCQLPPTVKSQQAQKEGLSKTLMEKMIALQPDTAAMLQVQYRMNTKIMEFSSQQFYHGALIAHESVANHHILGDVVEFIDTAGCSFDEKLRKESQSRYNPEEANLLARHLEAFLEASAAQNALPADLKIGIISPYSAQVGYIEELLRENTALGRYQDAIRVSSVDGFQGQECHVVYISLVRSNENGEIGFLEDTRRMNVALTRAKQKLVVIGDSATLGENKFYQAYLAYAEQIGAYKSAWEFLA